MPGKNAIQQLITAINLCFEHGLIGPTLVLLYSGIDTMAWLGLPENQHDVTGNDFIEWTERYLLPDSGIPCNALDLYSSRCGIVHSMSAESRAIRKGNATKLFYAWGNHRAEDLQIMIDHVGERAVAVQVDELIRAFQNAVDRYVKASEQDPALNSRVNERLDKILTNMDA